MGWNGGDANEEVEDTRLRATLAATLWKRSARTLPGGSSVVKNVNRPTLLGHVRRGAVVRDVHRASREELDGLSP